MKVELSIFKNTVSKKIFFLFILAAFLPVCIFTFFSTRQIDQMTEENILIQLQKNSKAYSYVLNDRLSARSTAMMQIASLISSSYDSSEWPLEHTHKAWFGSLSLFKGNVLNKTFWGAPPIIKNLSIDNLQFLSTGKTLLQVNLKSSPGSPGFIMIRQLFPLDKQSNNMQKEFLISVLNNSELLGHEDEFDHHTGFCLFNHMKQALFCSQIDIKKSIGAMISNIDLQSRGKLIWSNKETSLYAGYSNLFLEYHYFQKDWLIIFAQPKIESIFYREDFKTLFYSIIAITLLSVIYASSLLIRQLMRPLDALMQGISHISHGNFKQVVPIAGNDEFGQLSESFNRMSKRISSQINVLKALAEVDQLILSRLKTHDIINMAIKHANDIIDSDGVSFTSLTLQEPSTEKPSSKEHSSTAIMYTDDHQSSNKTLQQSYQIKNSLLKTLSEQEFFQFSLKETPLHSFVQPFINNGFKYFLIIPIRNQGKNIAFLSFAYHESPTLTDIEKKWGQEFSDRIAVAFANSSWEKQLYKQAYFDSLTGLPNRLMFNDRLQYTIDQAQRDKSTPIILFLDLDGFKFINDSLGHMLGDALLKKVAERVKMCLRKTDTVARLGGDEFVFIISGTHKKTSFSIITTIKKILFEISKPIILEGNSLRVTGSIGIALYPQDGNTVNTLLKNADVAMYEAKKQGRAQYQFYSEELNSSMLKKLLLDADLHDALEKNQFQLFYQAKVDTKTGLIIGAEALIRWIYPGEGVISPVLFIPLIEQSGLIIPIGHWVIQETCRQNKEWQDKGLKKIPISVNLSAKQFKEESLFSDIQQIIKDSELEAQYLEMEITETVAVDNLEESTKIIHQLKKIGITFSLDDYGTGYSSLEYIKDFPVDTLKIDRAFIINLVQSHKEQAIVKSTITMAHDLELKTIAEGVETQEQFLMLKQMNCDGIQGYLYSKPVSASDFEKLLIENRSLLA